MRRSKDFMYRVVRYRVDVAQSHLDDACASNDAVIVNAAAAEYLDAVYSARELVWGQTVLRSDYAEPPHSWYPVRDGGRIRWVPMRRRANVHIATDHPDALFGPIAHTLMVGRRKHTGGMSYRYWAWMPKFRPARKFGMVVPQRFFVVVDFRPTYDGRPYGIVTAFWES